MRTLVLGTHNQKKCRELVNLLAPLGVPLATLHEFPQAVHVEETGDTFAANAALKATQQAVHLCEWVLGEDSGLAVDALSGAPGVYSARYAGLGASDEANNAALLEALEAVPDERRGAHYVCHLVLSDPGGQVRAQTQAACNGRIRRAPAGEGGFGYDPLFEIVEYHRTFGELGESVKAVLSHRARAVAQFLPALEGFLEDLPK